MSKGLVLAFLIFAFILLLSAMIFELVIVNAHSDVQVFPFDSIEHKRVVNKLAMPECIAPFIIMFVCLLAPTFVGCALILPSAGVSVYKIVKRQIYFDSVTVHTRISLEEKLCFLRIIDYCIAWVYVLFRIIFTAVS